MHSKPICTSDRFLCSCLRWRSLPEAIALVGVCQTGLKALHHQALTVMLKVGEILWFHLTEIVVARSYLQLADKQ